LSGEKYLIFTVPYMVGKELLYFNTGYTPEFSWSDFSDLIPFTIGLVQGYTYGEKFLEAIAKYNLKIEYADSTETNIKKLAAGRVDLIVEESFVTETFLSRHPDWKVQISSSENPVAEYYYHMAFHREDRFKPFITKVNSLLLEMKANSSIQSVIDKYTGEQNN